jgi:hypothetical protein
MMIEALSDCPKSEQNELMDAGHELELRPP